MSTRSKTYYIRTFGCQMNLADSERIAGVYESKGYKKVKSIKDADLVIINTCSVRQSAENRVLGLVNNLEKLKIENCKLKIILTGCMLRYTLYQLKKILPNVDEFVKLKDLIRNSPACLSADRQDRRGRQSAIRNSRVHAWVVIMEGCDNFCTYCVVPSARGRERSRPFEEIVCEVKELVKRGYREITLLGQNVNSYGKNSNVKIQKSKRQLETPAFVKTSTFAKATADRQNFRKFKTPFAQLLAALHNIKGLEKIKFITSNPQDLTDDIIQAMKLPKIDRYLHLPVQSGDDQILKKMNRRYTSRQYLNLIQKLRREIPDLEIGTDIIVGFPGETKEQFQNTVDLCKKAKFKVAYIAKYSPRPGTAAYKLKDNVSAEEKKRRWQILNDLINK